jgi:UDP-N-acetylmuramoyl-tripeptide--D-alanyl-D-alanine ligase
MTRAAATAPGIAHHRESSMRWSLSDIARTVGTTWAGDASSGTFIPSALSIDTRTLSRGDLYLALVGERLDGHDFVTEAFTRGAAAAIVGPDFRAEMAAAALPLVRVPDTLAALHALAARSRGESEAQVVAITGSNGKTTTRDMTRCVLEGDGPVLTPVANRNNHIGLPLTLLDLGPEHARAVLELGMNHLGEIAMLSGLSRPHVALITNVARAHLGPVGGLEAVRRAKLEITEGLEPGGTLLVPADDPILVAAARETGVTVATFGFEPDADHTTAVAGPDTDGRFTVIMPRSPDGGEHAVTLSGPGRPLALAASATLAVARHLGVSPADAASRLERWTPMTGRMAPRRVDGITLLDDSYNATPDSMASALDHLRSVPCRGKRVAVLGEMRELGPQSVDLHRELGRMLDGIDVVILVGTGTDVTAEEARSLPSSPAVVRSDDVADVIRSLHTDLRSGDVVLVKGSRAVGRCCTSSWSP